MKRVVLSALIPLAIGCGNPPGTSDQPDAAIAGNPDAQDAPVEVASFSPADGAKRVAPHARITIQLSGAADPASISASTVKVFVAGTRYPVAGTVSYDATTHAITFTPAAPLATAARLEVDVEGVQAHGVAVAGASARFRVAVDNETTSVAFGADGNPDHYIKWTVDDDGDYLTEAFFSVGPDEKVGSADDVEQRWLSWKYAPGKETHFHYSGPGVDGTWGTADDVISSYTDWTLAPGGLLTRALTYTGAGADGTWGTDDDVVADVIQNSYDDLGRFTVSVIGTAGPDGKLGTADDVVSERDVASYPDASNASNEVDYDGPGPDHQWGTNDDHVASSHKVHVDAAGKLTTTEYFLPGDDGTVGTADDIQSGLDTSTYNAHGDVTAQTSAKGAGADGKWGTADDLLWNYATTTVDDDGLAVRGDRYSPGANEIGRDADDFETYTWTADTAH